jgi:hypothetical protein
VKVRDVTPAEDGTQNWQPNENQTSAEIHNAPADSPKPYPLQGDQLAGDVGERVGFHEIQVWINGAWAYENFYDQAHDRFNLFADRQWFALYRMAYLSNGESHAFDTYDERCPN